MNSSTPAARADQLQPRQVSRAVQVGQDVQENFPGKLSPAGLQAHHGKRRQGESVHVAGVDDERGELAIQVPQAVIGNLPT